MIHHCITVVCLLACSTSVLSAVTAQELFTRVSAFQKQTPVAGYTAEIRGEIVDKQLKTIAQDQFPNGRGNAQLLFYMKQGFLPKVKLEGVSSFYETMFSLFLPQLHWCGFYLAAAHSNFASFAKDYTITGITEKDALTAVTVKHRDFEDAHAVLTIDSNGMVSGGDYYMRGKLIMKTALEYCTISNYQFISQIRYQSFVDAPFSSVLYFTNHRSVKLDNKVFK